VVNIYIFLYFIFIAFYLFKILYWRPDASRKLWKHEGVLNKGTCVRRTVNNMFSKTLHKHNVNVLNILIGIGHIKAWWSYIIRIIYTFLKLHLPECIQPKQSLALPAPNTLHSPNISEPPKYSLLMPGTCSTIFHDCRSLLWLLPKATNVTSFQQPAINANCSQ